MHMLGHHDITPHSEVVFRMSPLRISPQGLMGRPAREHTLTAKGFKYR